MSIEQKIKEKITSRFAPEYLQVINESSKHQGHAGDDGSGESHFQLIIVSPEFEGKSRIERHRLVFQELEWIVENRIHALALDLHAPSECR